MRIKRNRFTLSSDKEIKEDISFDYSSPSEEGQTPSPPRNSRKLSRNQIIQIILAAAIVVVSVTIFTVLFIISRKNDDPIKKGSNKSVIEQLLPGMGKKEDSGKPENRENENLTDGINRYNAGNYPAATSLFHEVIEGDSTKPEKAQALFYLAKIEEINGNYTKAIDYLERSLKYNKKDAATYLFLGKLTNKNGDSKRALEYLTMALDEKKELDEAWLLTGNIHYGMGKFKEAADDYRKAVDINGLNAHAYYNRGLALLKLGERFDAIESFKRASSSSESRVAYMAYSKLGTLFLESNDIELAIKYFKLALTVDGGKAEDFFNLGLAYLAKNDKDTAIDFFKKAEEKGGEDLELVQRLGDIYSNSYNNYNKSMELYRKVAEKENRNVEILFKLGELLYKNGELNSSLVYFNRIAESKPASEDARKAWLYIGNIYDDSGRYQDAVDAYKKALNINPDDDKAYYNLGIAYKNLGDTVNAIEYWNRAYTANPDNPAPLVSIADMMYKQGYMDDALSEYAKITEKWPNNSEALFQIATIYNRKGIKTSAQKYYKQVVDLELDKELTRKSLINLSLIASENEDGSDTNGVNDSITYIKKALLLKPNDSQALYALGIIYYKKELYDQAIESFYQVVKASREQEETAKAYNNIGKSYFKKEEYQKAIRAFSLGIEQDPSNEELRINRRAASQMYEQQIGGI